MSLLLTIILPYKERNWCACIQDKGTVARQARTAPSPCSRACGNETRSVSRSLLRLDLEPATFHTPLLKQQRGFLVLVKHRDTPLRGKTQWVLRNDARGPIYSLCRMRVRSRAGPLLRRPRTLPYKLRTRKVQR